MYLPGGHLMWDMQKSVLVLLLDVSALKNPAAHNAHVGWEVAVPTAFVYCPGGHLVWAVQESVMASLLDVNVLKNPVAHASHLGSVGVATLVYLPGGHLLVWAVHHSKEQSAAANAQHKSERCDACFSNPKWNEHVVGYTITFPKGTKDVR